MLVADNFQPSACEAASCALTWSPPRQHVLPRSAAAPAPRHRRVPPRSTLFCPDPPAAVSAAVLPRFRRTSTPFCRLSAGVLPRKGFGVGRISPHSTLHSTLSAAGRPRFHPILPRFCHFPFSSPLILFHKVRRSALPSRLEKVPRMPRNPPRSPRGRARARRAEAADAQGWQAERG